MIGEGSAPVIVVAAVIEQDDAFFVARRQAGTHLEGYWEFPGGKCGRGEGHVEALRREIREELDADVKVFDRLMEVSHEYDDRRVEIHFYRCTLVGVPRPMLGQDTRWVSRHELRTLTFPPADEELIARLSGGG